jgi:BASS family bile acid:Na+ symporter
MTFLIAVLEAVGRHASLALVAGIGLSLVMPAVSHALSPLFPAIVVGTLMMSFARIDLARAARQWRRPDRLPLALALLMVLWPLALWALAGSLGLPAVLLLPLVLLAASPPLASGASFAFIMGLDAELAVNLVLAGTLVMPLVAPPLVFGVLALGLEVDVWAMFLRLAALIAIAVAAAAAIRRLAGRERIVRRGVMLDGIATLWMIAFLIVIMDGVPALIAAEPGLMALLLAAGAVANLGFPLLVLAAGWPLARRGGEAPAAVATVAMFAGNRNMGLVLTALPAALFTEVGPFVALYQIPIYLTPLVMTPVFRRFIGRGLRAFRV